MDLGAKECSQYDVLSDDARGLWLVRPEARRKEVSRDRRSVRSRTGLEVNAGHTSFRVVALGLLASEPVFVREVRRRSQFSASVGFEACYRKTSALLDLVCRLLLEKKKQNAGRDGSKKR